MIKQTEVTWQIEWGTGLSQNFGLITGLASWYLKWPVLVSCRTVAVRCIE